MGGLKGSTLKQLSSVKLATPDECCNSGPVSLFWCLSVLMETTGSLVGMFLAQTQWTIIRFYSVLNPTAEAHVQGHYLGIFKRLGNVGYHYLT